ncbi:MAG: TerB family tellurite resistance protein [Alphaproteobacteria bacterium]|tara:strand:- start:293 stop:736 length:444 start_codon:yes stop_codon:yes gene_type:complete
MKNFLKQFKNIPIDNKTIDSKQKKILIASILIECAKSDNKFTDDEIEKIKFLLEKKVHVASNEVADVFEKAIKMTENNIEVYSLTKDIRDNFSKVEILQIFEYMWEIVLSDGILDDFEASLMRQLTGLFHLSGRESAEARKKAESIQ